MNTTELIARLPKSVQERLKTYRNEYEESVGSYGLATEKRIEIKGYCKALQDVGLVNKEERQRIYSYLTI